MVLITKAIIGHCKCLQQDIRVRWEECKAGDCLLVWDTRFNNNLCKEDRVVVGRMAGEGGDLVCKWP